MWSRKTLKQILSFLHPTVDTWRAVYTAETLQNSAKGENGCVNEKEPDGEVREASVFFPLAVAKETTQRCHHSRLRVTGDVQEMAAGGQRG